MPQARQTKRVAKQRKQSKWESQLSYRRTKAVEQCGRDVARHTANILRNSVFFGPGGGDARRNPPRFEASGTFVFRVQAGRRAFAAC